MILDLPDADIDFVLHVLHNQPLPFVRVAPIINRIGQQVVEHQRALATRAAPAGPGEYAALRAAYSLASPVATPA